MRRREEEKTGARREYRLMRGEGNTKKEVRERVVRSRQLLQTFSEQQQWQRANNQQPTQDRRKSTGNKRKKKWKEEGAKAGRRKEEELKVEADQRQ